MAQTDTILHRPNAQQPQAFGWYRALWSSWKNRRKRRQGAQALNALPGRALRDIGLTCADAERALHDTASQTQSGRLYRAAKQQSGNW